MRKRTKLLSAAAGASLAAIGVLAATGAAGPSISLTDVRSANTKAPGLSSPNILSPELQEVVWAQGSWPLEKPVGVDTANKVAAYGYDANGTFLPVSSTYTADPPASVTFSTTPIEASKTEPDKNTYLVLDGQTGADPNYDYGRHFLFQGHETGAPGFITRINLDADGAHRVTLLATQDARGTDLPTFDGSTWNPWAQRLLFTAEGGTKGGVWQATPAAKSTVDNLQPYLGRGGYEGIQNDDQGNLYIVEDVGGDAGSGATPTDANTKSSKRPNSFIFRFLPKDRGDLTKGGTIQALQILRDDKTPMTYGDPSTGNPPVAPDSTILSQDMKDLHTYGKSFDTKWIDIASTPDAVKYGPTGPDVNALARAAGATPLKRPENGVFQPGSKFTQFYFTETGDTNANSAANAGYGGFGGVFRLTQKPSSKTGSITLFYLGDKAHTGFDNLAFFGENQLAVVEDAGDTLHTQRNALDSAYMLDTTADYSTSPAPVRFLAEGRDASATIDSALGTTMGRAFGNDGDNEITGIHVSDGDPGKNGILGAKKPKPFRDGKWRAFWTQQHGDNNTFELIPTNANRSSGYDENDG
jgi:hypothetical protein